ncbi:alcohol dehydrogenase catalytic domain-containing protein [Streptomyces purpurogeneiscleroticus]|uniref:alcohol dehydrogenase catalytic domain-containing protein n=1 Tax=Streptomyces purpurogeneiscleroticus TaxID=68259 RepID=UPI001CBF603A
MQGADVCGRVVAVGDGVPHERIGERVLVRTMLRGPVDFAPYACWTYGSECDGGFAQYATAPAADTYAVASDWSDAELAAVPCAYSTAENMLHRADVGAEHVLITGASGGVGLAAVQLAKRRGATLTAVFTQGDRSHEAHPDRALPGRPALLRRHLPALRWPYLHLLPRLHRPYHL